ncbi:MAG: tRNA-(ms[2]io[6]A)-hydroxylase [Deltaproteobacteria bacterium]|nr:tRNA-(ms[2]io[6]A)-hydroxylase [Deltaproteobacteria bacterium]MBW2383137.1 tRNA-(ms[2]io[6]A)-hydroxylase [Deltaproteobacteria bacterium]
MLNLVSASNPAWLESALAQIEEVLVDHAHCEKKAAGAAVKLLFAYPHHRFMQEPIAALAREELEHFERTLALLERKGIAYRSMPPSPYGARLHAHVRHREPERCLDVLLVAALIEARSCERMKLLADAVVDPEIAVFYRDLLASEARHHRLYVDLAIRLSDETTTRDRLAELALVEWSALAEPAPFVRLHT